MDRVAIAQIRRTRGIRGEVVATPFSDHRGRFADLKRVFAGGRELTVEEAWWHGEDIVFRFAGIGSIEAAQPLAGLDVEIPAAERVQLPEGQFYPDQLLGLEVFDAGQSLGLVTGWQDLGTQTLIEAGGVEFPYRLIRRVDLDARRIEVDLPEGLKDLNRE